MKAVPILARTAGLLAHLAEEQRAAARLPDGRARRRRRSSTSRRVMLDARGRDPPVGRAARARRRAYRAQLAYLFERSAFYREKLAAAGSTAAAAGGLAEIARLPLTEKQRAPGDVHARRTRSARTSARRRRRSSASTRRAARPARRATSRSPRATSTTGSPARRAATRRPASRAGQRIVSTYNAGPFVAGAALAAFDRIGLCHIPVGTGQHRAADAGDRAARARGGRC